MERGLRVEAPEAQTVVLCCRNFLLISAMSVLC
jgi:hypothetical protein